MPRSRNSRNRTNKNRNTVSQQRANANAAIDGRGGRISSYTGGARTVGTMRNARGYNVSDAEGMRDAWQNRTNVATYTSSRNGRLSTNGRNADGSTWTYTNRDMEGNLVSQSGRKQIATRRQRDYDTRVGMNNISPKVIERWKQLGMVREVDGRLVGDNGNVIRQQADGTYSWGMSAG